MKLPENMYNSEELEAIKNANIDLDFNKEYSSDEIGDITLKLQDACLDYGFTKCKPNEKCRLWERICDIFVDVTDKLI